MTFEDVWGQVKGLSDIAMIHVPERLSADTKRRLAKMNPDKVSEIVKNAIDEVNHGSTTPLDTLIRCRLLSGVERFFLKTKNRFL